MMSKNLLEHSEKSFKLFYGKSSNPVLITNPQGRIKYVNHAWEKLTGYLYKEVIDKNPQFLYSEKTPKNVHKDLWVALLKGKAYTTEEIVDKRKDGSEYHVYSSFFPIRYGRKMLFFVQIQHDITVRMKLNNKLKVHSFLLQKMHEGVCLVRMSDGIIIYTNHGFERMLGYKKHELRNKHVSVINYGTTDEIKRATDGILNKLERYGSNSYVIQNKKKDGKPIWCKVNASVFAHSYFGKVGIAVYVDITKEKEYQDQIKLSERRLREFVKQASEGIFFADSTGKLTDVNAAGYHMLGYSKSEIIGKSIKELLPREDVKRYAKTRARLLKGESIVSEWHPIRKDGNLLPVEVSSKILSDGRWLNLVRDITEKKHLEHMRDTFISMVSHELKTPITTIKAFAQLLLRNNGKDLTEAKIAYFAKHIETESERLNLIVSDLLNLGRLQTGNMIIMKKYFDLNELIKNVIANIQYTTAQHSIKYTEADPQIVYADRERIGQVLINMLTNAIKYAPGTKEIIVSTSTDANGVTVSVQDFGKGIAKEHQKLIFKSFYRVSEKGKEGRGTSIGLGLYISTEIIKKHRGRIWVESKPGKGSTFFFSLPRR